MRIAIYAFDGVSMFHLSVPQLVFGEVSRQGRGSWSTQLFADRRGRVRTAEGNAIGGLRGLDATTDADVVVVPSWHDDGRPAPDRLSRAIAAAHRRGALIVGLCLGAIPVADAGLLGGRRAVTHWAAFPLLAARHPDVELDEKVLYVDHGDVLTSAGTASGLDASLHVVRSKLGAEAANSVARSLVIAPHREGGQAQYIERPLAVDAGSDAISGLLAWALEHLDEPLSVDGLARRARQSRRTFIRAFRATTGSSPAAWVRAQRIDQARRLLETSDLSVEQIAAATGIGSAVTLRQAFRDAFATTPTAYRRRFASSDAPLGQDAGRTA